jgi:hypothetical protein
MVHLPSIENHVKRSVSRIVQVDLQHTPSAPNRMRDPSAGCPFDTRAGLRHNASPRELRKQTGWDQFAAVAANLAEYVSQRRVGEVIDRVECAELNRRIPHPKLRKVCHRLADELRHDPRLDSGDGPTIEAHEDCLGATLAGFADLSLDRASVRGQPACFV